MLPRAGPDPAVTGTGLGTGAAMAAIELPAPEAPGDGGSRRQFALVGPPVSVVAAGTGSGRGGDVGGGGGDGAAGAGRGKKRSALEAAAATEAAAPAKSPRVSGCRSPGGSAPGAVTRMRSRQDSHAAAVTARPPKPPSFGRIGTTRVALVADARPAARARRESAAADRPQKAEIIGSCVGVGGGTEAAVTSARRSSAHGDGAGRAAKGSAEAVGHRPSAGEHPPRGYPVLHRKAEVPAIAALRHEPGGGYGWRMGGATRHIAPAAAPAVGRLADRADVPGKALQSPLDRDCLAILVLTRTRLLGLSLWPGLHVRREIVYLISAVGRYPRPHPSSFEENCPCLSNAIHPCKGLSIRPGSKEGDFECEHILCVR